MRATIGEPAIKTADHFHAQIAAAFSFPHYYGRNLNALWDVLRIDTERPVELVWLNSAVSKDAMGADFERIMDLFRDLAADDEEHGLPVSSLVLR